MKKMILNNKTLNSLEVLIEYLTDCEKMHYEACNERDKVNHIYNHIETVKRALETRFL